MDIINWLNKIFGVDNTISVPIIASIIVFIVGGIAITIKEKIADVIQKSRNRNSFTNIITEIARTCKIKSKRIKEFYPKLGINISEDWYFNFNSITYLSIAFNQDYSTIYNSFNSKINYKFDSKFRAKCFNKLWSYLEYFKFNDEKMISDFNEFFHKFNQHEIAYQNLMEQLRNQKDNFFFNNQTVPIADKRLKEYIEKMDRISYEWQQMEKCVELYNTYNFLVLPLRKLNKEYSDIKFSIEQNNILLPATYEYMQMVKILSVCKQTFKNYYHNYNNGYRMLLFCITKIK